MIPKKYTKEMLLGKKYDVTETLEMVPGKASAPKQLLLLKMWFAVKELQF